MSKTHITKPWITTIFVLVLLIAMIIVWILVGEFNTLHLQWLIAHNGTLWSGKVDGKQEWLQNTFGKWINNDQQIPSSGYWTLTNPKSLIFNPLILIPLLSCLLLSIVVPLFFKIFHIMNIDVLSYSITSTFSLFILIITGLIPHWNNGDIWLWIIRIIILLICVASIFLITNRVVNKFLSNSAYANAIVNEFNQIESEKKPYRASLKNLGDQVNEKDKMKYVEED